MKLIQKKKQQILNSGINDEDLRTIDIDEFDET